MNIYGSPSCTFTQFLQHLVYESSPATNEAQLIWDIFIQYRIDPAVALGFYHHESQCGTKGRAVVTKSWGNIRFIPLYERLAYPVKDIDGFAAYPSPLVGARHFGQHIRSIDGTSNYFGLNTVEQVVPIWAPSTSNSPIDYIKAVVDFVDRLSGKKQAVAPRILNIAGHVNTKNITVDGLCDGLDKIASAAALRGMTGTRGEQDFTANIAQKMTDAMNATGLLEARAIDCTYSKADYIDWKPQLAIAHHIHRDGEHRAMFAIPDNKFSYHSKRANDESFRYMARIMGRYTDVTGIPLDQPGVTLRMTQLYNWCYIDDECMALIGEYGNGDLDTVALFNEDSLKKIVDYFVACTLEHFNLSSTSPVPTPTPQPSPTPTPTLTPPVDPTPSNKLLAAKALAKQIVDL